MPLTECALRGNIVGHSLDQCGICRRPLTLGVAYIQHDPMTALGLLGPVDILAKPVYTRV